MASQAAASDSRQARRQSGEGGRQGGGCRGRTAPRHRDRGNPESGDSLRPAQKRKPRAADVADRVDRRGRPGSTVSPRLVSTLIHPPGASQPAWSDGLHDRGSRAGRVRRVGEDEVERLRSRQRKRGACDRSAIGRAKLVGVATNDRRRPCGSFSTKVAEPRPARQRFEAERAASGEKVGDPQAPRSCQGGSRASKRASRAPGRRSGGSRRPAALRSVARATCRR